MSRTIKKETAENKRSMIKGKKVVKKSQKKSRPDEYYIEWDTDDRY